ncbi:hypothetical protein EOB59_03365 [Mesorhizobium sp. M7A.F.Ca.MR.176.00.0.0]|uniref:hypothetical protein n=1 Tax=Mesorhizobium sp. M7A.F.Ca.MR.176.00.0.0 TaxID=2496776 RepID=UPI000FD422D7|nr:hypothetical protein [Mesorhizobium sp. M7A.F.Ca.MR.176.00.0.0]RUU93354.1 hypothetical protein EOB59_03365 [Mesorhizobium sp. M7A.F.Ca.MR.176.00.0.0]
MRRNTVLQILAAAITIAILAAIHQGLGLILDRFSRDFVSGLFFGSIGMTIVFMILIWADQKRLAARRRTEQQGSRNIIDL